MSDHCACNSKLAAATSLLLASYIVAKSASAVLVLEGKQYEDKKGAGVGDDLVTGFLRGAQRGGYLGCVILGGAMMYAFTYSFVKSAL